MGWTLTSFRTYLKLHLSDAAIVWSQDQIDRCVRHALADFSRFYPREQFYEVRLDFDAISAESVTLVAGTKTLAYKPVKWDSESVTDTDGNACVRGTDYEMDYIAGSITRISGGEIASATETIAVTYTRDKVAIDVSSLTYLRIHKVEYPVGQIPQDFVPFTEFGEMLFIKGVKGGNTASQASLQNDKHARVLYYAPHVGAESTSAGTAPDWSDEIVLKGAEAYAYLMEAGQYEQQAATDFTSARAELAAHAAIHSLLAAALGNIATEAETANSTLDGLTQSAATDALAAASSALDKIAAGPGSEVWHTLADTALDAAAAELALLVKMSASPTGSELYDVQQVPECEPGSEGDMYLTSATTPPSSHDYLIDGDDAIPTVNVGEDVAPLHMQYANAAGQIGDRLRDHARLHLERGALHMQAIMGFVQEAQGHLNHVAMYVAEAQAENATGQGYIADNANTLRQAEGYVANASMYARQAAHYVEEIEQHGRAADRYIMIGTQSLELATSYREMGILRRNEFWAILGDRSQGSTSRVSVPGNQSPTGGTGRDQYVG